MRSTSSTNWSPSRQYFGTTSCSYIHQRFNAAKNLFSMPNLRTVSVSFVRYVTTKFSCIYRFPISPSNSASQRARKLGYIIKPTNKALNICVVSDNSLTMFFSYQLPNFKPRGALVTGTAVWPEEKRFSSKTEVYLLISMFSENCFRSDL